MHLVAFVHQDEEEVEAAHDGGRQVDVLLQALAAVVAPADGVGGGQDGGAGVQGGLRREEDESETASSQTPLLYVRFFWGWGYF